MATTETKKIKITCTSGMTLPLSELETIPSMLKKRSTIETDKLIDSILRDGFAFPFFVCTVDRKNWVIDGEGRLEALALLKHRGYELPDEFPVVYVKAKKETLRRKLIACDARFHCVTKTSLEDFVRGHDVNLKQYMFDLGTPISFLTATDLDINFVAPAGKTLKEKLNPADFYFLEFGDTPVEEVKRVKKEKKPKQE